MLFCDSCAPIAPDTLAEYQYVRQMKNTEKQMHIASPFGAEDKHPGMFLLFPIPHGFSSVVIKVTAGLVRKCFVT